MNREQMVEKAARIIYDESGSVTNVDSFDIASNVIAAILPQVSTVAELALLPDEAALVTSDGRFFRAYVAQLAPDKDCLSWPLTVVWQPEVTR